LQAKKEAEKIAAAKKAAEEKAAAQANKPPEPKQDNPDTKEENK